MQTKSSNTFFLKSADVDPKLDFLYAPNKAIDIVEFYAPWWSPPLSAFFLHFVGCTANVETLIGPGFTRRRRYIPSRVAHRTLCHAWDVHGYPRLLLFLPQDDELYSIASYFELHLRCLGRSGLKSIKRKCWEKQPSETTTAAAADTRRIFAAN
jgi:hypothetical protein